MSIDKLTADDRALLREVFRAARAKGWSRAHRDLAGRFWADDRDTHIELTCNGWLITPISESECVTVQLAVDILVAVGVLPIGFSSQWRDGFKVANDAVYDMVKVQVAEWYDDLRSPVERGWPKAEKVGYLQGVADAVDNICDVIGVTHPEWDHMRDAAIDTIVDVAQAGAR